MVSGSVTFDTSFIHSNQHRQGIRGACQRQSPSQRNGAILVQRRKDLETLDEPPAHGSPRVPLHQGDAPVLAFKHFHGDLGVVGDMVHVDDSTVLLHVYTPLPGFHVVRHTLQS